MSQKQPTGTPNTWRKTTRMNPMQRFKMYNPLQMEFSSVAMPRHNISFGFHKKHQHQLQRIEVNRIKASKRKLVNSIARTMNVATGSIRTFGAEKTFELSQDNIADSVDLNTSKKIFDLSLPEHAPYKIDYTSNGQYLALCGQRGHLSIIRWADFRLISEEYFDVQSDYIHDVKFAMNESMLCVAQREGVYIYNTKCVETHVCRRSMFLPLALDYLPYHFLLCCVGQQGNLVYFDVSLGKKVRTQHTELGACDLIRQNPSNAVIHLGHDNGTVTMWTPTNRDPVARMMCHPGRRVRGLAVNHAGSQMATSDDNGHLRIWDLRTFKELHHYRSPGTDRMISHLDYSQKGLLAFSIGGTVRIWNLNRHFQPCQDEGAGELRGMQRHLYLSHKLNRRGGRDISSLKFCPYEDVLGIGNTDGFASIVVPGAGEPNYDLFENNPFETKRQRNNKIVYQLLDKLQPDMIQMDPNFIANTPRANYIEESQQESKVDRKWARKNVNKNVKKGYRGVIHKRYSKYLHMKDLHVRQERLIKQLNVRKKLHSNEAKAQSLKTKDKIVKHLTRRRDEIPAALNRFSGPKQSTNHQQFKSHWRRRAKKIHF